MNTTITRLRVAVKYPLFRYIEGALDDPMTELAKNYNGNATGNAGIGFGHRDIEFIFPTRDDLNGFLVSVHDKWPYLETTVK